MSNLVIHGEWIGRRVVVDDALNVSLVGTGGVVLDETKHFLVLETDSGVKRVPKHGATFRVYWDGKEVVVSGDDLVASPEERVKRKVKG